MKLTLILTISVLSLRPLALVPLSAQETNINQLIAELQGKTKLKKRSAEQRLRAYSQVIRSLLPGMASEKTEQNQGPQQTLQDICWHASRPGAEEERSSVCKAIVSFLRTDTPTVAQKWLVKQLGYIGREESVAALGAFLSDKDENIAECARRALGSNPSPKAGEKLREALASAQTPDWRAALINALGSRKESANAASLKKQAADENDTVRCAALEALAALEDKESADFMTASMEKGSSHLRAVATDAYLRLAEVLSRSNDRQAALAIYKKLLNSEGHVQCAAVLGVGRAGGVRDLPLLFEALADKDVKVQGAAKSALSFLPAKEVNAAIAGKLKAASSEFKVTLLEALSESRDPHTLPVLVEAVHDPESSVRVAALRAMGGLAAKSAIPVLIDCLTRGQGQELEAAQNALALIPGDGVVDAVAKALGLATPKGRVQLLRALSSRPSDRVMALLKKAVADPELPVRVETLRMMARFAGAKELPFLLTRLLAQKNDREQAACQEAIAAVCHRVPDRKMVMDRVNEQYRNGSKEVQIALLPVFGLVGGGSALASVRAAWTSEDAQIKDAALQTLIEWPDASVAEDLLNIVRTVGDLRHRRLALRGLVQVVGLPDAFPPGKALDIFQTAMKAAPEVEDRKLVLAGIGGVKDVKALQVAEAWLGEEALQAEAAAALLRIAEGVRWQDSAQASTALARVVEVSIDTDLQQKAKALLEDLARYEDYITAWVYSGPWMEKGKKLEDLFDLRFPPETDQATSVDWRPALPGEKPEKSWAVDFNRMDRGDDRVGYIRSWVWAPTAARAQLEVGSDDSVKVWLNDKLVDSFKGNRAVAPAQEKVTVELNHGWNSLLLKVINGGGDWDGAARFRSEDGSHLKEVAVLGQPDFTNALLKELQAPNPDPVIAPVAMDVLIATTVPKQQAKAMLQAAVKLTPDEKLRKKAGQVLNDYEKYEDYIMEWQVSGPYVKEGKDGTALFDVPFPPESPDAKGVQWKPTHAEGLYEVPLEKLFGGDNRGAYLKCWIVSPEEVKAQLEVGSDDGIKAWLNGNVVHANNALRALIPGQDKAQIILRPGVNMLMLKITQQSGHWSACARIRAAEGSHIEGLQLSGEEPAKAK